MIISQPAQVIPALPDAVHSVSIESRELDDERFSQPGDDAKASMRASAGKLLQEKGYTS